MATKPFDIVKSLSNKTDLEYPIADYDPWIINRAFSNTIDTIFFAEICNRYYESPKDIQRDFYKYAVPKGKRFGTWYKADINTTVDLIMNHYQVNRKVAEGYLKIMSSRAVEELKEKTNTGGRK